MRDTATDVYVCYTPINWMSAHTFIIIIDFNLFNLINCEIIFILGSQCLWIIKMLLVCRDLDCHFMSNWFVVLLCMTLHYCLPHMWRPEFHGYGLPMKSTNIIPHKQWLFHSILHQTPPCNSFATDLFKCINDKKGNGH